MGLIAKAKAAKDSEPPRQRASTRPTTINHLWQVLRQRATMVAVCLRETVQHLLAELDVLGRAVGANPVVEHEAPGTYHHLLSHSTGREPPPPQQQANVGARNRTKRMEGNRKPCM